MSEWKRIAKVLIVGMLLTVALIAVAYALSWCILTLVENDEPARSNQQLFVEVVEVDGIEVPCVVYDSSRDAGAVDCDFRSDR